MRGPCGSSVWPCGRVVSFCVWWTGTCSRPAFRPVPPTREVCPLHRELGGVPQQPEAAECWAHLTTSSTGLPGSGLRLWGSAPEPLLCWPSQKPEWSLLHGAARGPWPPDRRGSERIPRAAGPVCGVEACVMSTYEDPVLPACGAPSHRLGLAGCTPPGLLPSAPARTPSELLRHPRHIQPDAAGLPALSATRLGRPCTTQPWPGTPPCGPALLLAPETPFCPVTSPPWFSYLLVTTAQLPCPSSSVSCHLAGPQGPESHHLARAWYPWPVRGGSGWGKRVLEEQAASLSLASLAMGPACGRPSATSGSRALGKASPMLPAGVRLGARVSEEQCLVQSSREGGGPRGDPALPAAGLALPRVSSADICE